MQVDSSIGLALAVLFLILLTVFRLVYYYFSFCTPYILRSFSHSIDDTNVIDEFLKKRPKYIYLSIFLFYFFVSFYILTLVILFAGNIWFLTAGLFLFLLVFFFLDSFVKDWLFLNINKFLDKFSNIFSFVKLFEIFFLFSNLLISLNDIFFKFFGPSIGVNRKYFAEALVYLDDFDWDDYRIEILEKVLYIDDTLVREVMIPRVDIVALEANKNVSEVIFFIMKYGYSKYPIYEESIDNIIGVVFVKDMLKYMFTNQGFIKLKDISRIPVIIPETKNLYELINIMKQNRSSIVIVVDEYGGTSGIVTISDVIQELIGKFYDEHDKDIEEENFQKVSNNEYIINPKVDIYTLEEFLGIDFPDKESRDYTTLSGLIYTKLGRIPKEGEVIEIDNIVIKILEIRKNRINKVLLRIE